MNLLAISVNNTRTQLGLFHDGRLAEQVFIPNSDTSELGPALSRLYETIADAEDPVVYLASVNDTVAEAAAATVAETLGCGVTRIETDVSVPIGRQLDREALVGQDRLLNGAAAYDQLKQACIVVDAGTTVTVDFVDGEGTFHGGAILPGLRMGLDALNAGTAQLPQIEMAAPAEAIGHNTTQAMLSGAYHGTRGAVRELVEKYAEAYGAYPKVIATGGDAELLFRDYELIEAIVPDLTLRGMLVARRYELEQAGG